MPKKIPKKMSKKPVTKETRASNKPVNKVSEAMNKSKINPIGDRVVIKPLLPEEAGTMTASGIIIPDTVGKEKPERGTVIAVGPGKYEGGKLIPIRVKVQDVVVFSKYGYDEVKVDGVEYLIIREDSILAVIK